MRRAATRTRRRPGARASKRAGFGLATAGAGAVSSAALAPAAHAEGVQDQQWYLDAMQIPKVWKVSTGEGMTVAVVGTGVDRSTTTLLGQVLPAKTFVEAPGDETKDGNGHGATAAEIIAGTGRNGTLKGLAPDVRILPFRAGLEGIKDVKRGTLGGEDEAARAAADSEANIIYLAFNAVPGAEMEEALNYATRKGELLIAPAGDDGSSGNSMSGILPSAHPNVATVAASGKDSKVSEFSSYGDTISLSAPGEQLPSWCDAKREQYCSDAYSTTYSAAIASGAAALVWARHPHWTANQVLRVLLKKAGRADHKQSAPSRYIGYGAVRPRINLLEGEGKPGDPVTHPLTGKKVKKSSPEFQDRKPAQANDADTEGHKQATDSTAGGGGSNSVLPLVAVGAGVVVAAGCVVAAVRLRRN